MASIHTLCQEGCLVSVHVPLGRNEFPDRQFFAFPECVRWMEEVVPTLKSGKFQSVTTPVEQLDMILHNWISGGSVRYNRMFKDLMPASTEVWEMKSADLRIFGWLNAPNSFIAVLGGYADDYKGGRPKSSYEDATNRVIAARLALGLDEPKIARGTFDDLVRV